MLHAILTDPDNGYLYIRADGELTKDDYASFVPAFNQLIKSSGKAYPIMVELGTDFSGWSMKGLWEELKFDERHRKQFGRIAVVGDNRWEKWGTELADVFFDAEMRFFDHAKRANAEQWLLGQKMTELP